MKATASLQSETPHHYSAKKSGLATQNPLQRKIAPLQTQHNPLQFAGANMPKPGNNPLQLKRNTTGLPDNLKVSVETLSGMHMDDVRVHYNSDKPTQLQALAYAQGTDIHIAPGQEKHLPHEAWHVVQQKQGRVRPTLQMEGKVGINDDADLENEADKMGHQTLSSLYKNAVPLVSEDYIGEPYMQAVAQRNEDDGAALPFDFWQTLLYYSIVTVLPSVTNSIVNFVYSQLARQPEVVETVEKIAAESKSVEVKEEILLLVTEIEDKILEQHQEAQEKIEEKPIESQKQELVEEKQKDKLEEPPSITATIEELKQETDKKLDLELPLEKESKMEIETEPVKKKPVASTRKTYASKSRNNRRRNKLEKEYETEETAIEVPVKNNGFMASSSQLKRAIKNTGQEYDTLKDLANWVSDEEMWSALTSNSAAVTLGLDLASSSASPEVFKAWKEKEKTDYQQAAKDFMEFRRFQSTPKAPVKEVKKIERNSLSQVEKYWKKGTQQIEGGLEGGELSVANSKSGGGMLLLKGLKVTSQNQNAHISLPSDGNGFFSEGHLKIEGGDSLNQYFFSVDESGKISKLSNSPTVKTQNPGKWSDLPSNVWSSVKAIVLNLAVGNLG